MELSGPCPQQCCRLSTQLPCSFKEPPGLQSESVLYPGLGSWRPDLGPFTLGVVKLSQVCRRREWRV